MRVVEHAVLPCPAPVLPRGTTCTHPLLLQKEGGEGNGFEAKLGSFVASLKFGFMFPQQEDNEKA